jgi:hypothetical protein
MSQYDPNTPAGEPSGESEKIHLCVSSEECKLQSWSTVVQKHVTQYKLGYFGVLCVIAAYAIQRSKR